MECGESYGTFESPRSRGPSSDLFPKAVKGEIPALDGVRNLRQKLGLSLTKDTFTNRAKLKLEGMSDYAVEKSQLISRVLVEAITYNEGYYARFFILVQMGIGCTVWYAFAPGDGINPPSVDLAPIFDVIENYEPFYWNPDWHVLPGFNKVFLADGHKIQGESCQAVVLAEAFSGSAGEKPFIGLDIPMNQGGYIAIAVSLGLAIAIILTLGLQPTAGDEFI